MSDTASNSSNHSSSRPDMLDGTGITRQTQGSGQPDSSDKHATMDGQTLNDIPGRDDVQEMTVEHSRNLSIQELSKMRSSIRGLFEEMKHAIKEDIENAIKPIGESCQRINRGMEDMSNSVASMKATATELSKNVAGMHADIKEIRRDMEYTHTCFRKIVSIVTPPVATKAATKAQEEGPGQHVDETCVSMAATRSYSTSEA